MIAASLLFVSLIGCVQEDELKHTKDSFDTIKKNIEMKKAIMIDVREKSEWNAGHLQGAKLIPWSKLRFSKPKSKLKEIPDDDLIIYCHCKAGVRALRAAKKLKSLGYDARAIKAGFDELVDNGFERSKK